MFTLFLADGAPRFNATPPYFVYVPDSASSFTLSWDYDDDGETVKYVELSSYLGLVARKFPNHTLQVKETGHYAGRVTSSGRATFTISNITPNDSTVYICQINFISSIHPRIYHYLALHVVGK